MSYYLIGLSHGLESVTAELLQTREGHKKMCRTAIATIAFLGLITSLITGPAHAVCFANMTYICYDDGKTIKTPPKRQTPVKPADKRVCPQ